MLHSTQPRAYLATIGSSISPCKITCNQEVLQGSYIFFPRREIFSPSSKLHVFFLFLHHCIDCSRAHSSAAGQVAARGLHSRWSTRAKEWTLLEHCIRKLRMWSYDTNEFFSIIFCYCFSNRPAPFMLEWGGMQMNKWVSLSERSDKPYVFYCINFDTPLLHHNCYSCRKCWLS